MTHAKLQNLLTRFTDRKIGVIGDFALDCYWTVAPDAALPSVETGKPTRPVSQQSYAAGAAGNVVAALAAMGCKQITAFGVIGNDPWGIQLKRTLESLNADCSGLIQQERDWATVAYVKPHINGSEQNRIDFGDFNQLHENTAQELLSTLQTALPDLDAVVINAQARAGIHNAELQHRLQVLIEEHPEKLFTVDSREPETMYAGGILKINNHELAKIDKSTMHPDKIYAAVEKLYAKRKQPVFVTCGDQGIVACDANGITNIAGILTDGPIDTTGAGDATMAGITAALASKASPPEAAWIGNLAAAVCIRKLHQTGTASPAEMLALHKRYT